VPELPEVETIRRQLATILVGRRVTGIEVREEKSYLGPKRVDQVITKVGRVGKYLYFDFADGSMWEIHLKMTGRLIWDRADYEKAKHTRVVVVRVVSERKQLGKDPWEMSEAELMRKLQKTGRSVKEAILDQSLLAGVGNIYANDGLWEARINPKQKANTLTIPQVKKLLSSLRRVMERGLATGGASDNSYVNAKGEMGSYQNEFLVYGRTGEPCNRCGTKLERIVVGGRGTWVCQKCQL